MPLGRYCLISTNRRSRKSSAAVSFFIEDERPPSDPTMEKTAISSAAEGVLRYTCMHEDFRDAQLVAVKSVVVEDVPYASVLTVMGTGNGKVRHITSIIVNCYFELPSTACTWRNSGQHVSGPSRSDIFWPLFSGWVPAGLEELCRAVAVRPGKKSLVNDEDLSEDALALWRGHIGPQFRRRSAHMVPMARFDVRAVCGAVSFLYHG